MSILESMRQMGLELPTPLEPIGSYSAVSIIGDHAYVSGLGPIEAGIPRVGVVGRDLLLPQAKDAAHLTMMLILAGLEQACGLDRVSRCIRLTVYVRADASFTEHAKVADGATDLLRTIFGPEDLPARSAIGVQSLPMGIPVEIDSIFELRGS